MTRKVKDDMMDTVAKSVGAGHLVKGRKRNDKAMRDTKAKKMKSKTMESKPKSSFAEETPKYETYMDRRRKMEEKTKNMGSGS